VRKAKILFPILVTLTIGAVSMISCSKSNNSTTVVKDSIYYSPWENIVMSPTDGGDTIYTGTISASSITETILSSGAVMTYLGEPGYPSAGDTAAEIAVDYGLYCTEVPGAIDLTSLGYLNDFSTGNYGFLFRYVVIPGTILETTGLTRQQLKSMSFTEVTKALNAASTHASSPSLSTP
jgi:hypothetical protein